MRPLIGRRPKPVIPARWFRLAPGHRLGWWVRLDRERKRRGIRKNDIEAIRLLARELGGR